MSKKQRIFEAHTSAKQGRKEIKIDASNKCYNAKALKKKMERQARLQQIDQSIEANVISARKPRHDHSPRAKGLEA